MTLPDELWLILDEGDLGNLCEGKAACCVMCLPTHQEAIEQMKDFNDYSGEAQFFVRITKDSIIQWLPAKESDDV